VAIPTSGADQSEAAVPPERHAGPTPVMLPSAASRWYDRTAALYAQLEQDEQQAAEALRLAQERHLAARRAKAAIGKVLDFVAVETPPTPRPAALPSPGATDTPTRRSAHDTSAEDGGAWHPRYRKGCAGCGTTDRVNRPHRGRGRCGVCYEAKWPTKDGDR
jgi:hypothetical protein